MASITNLVQPLTSVIQTYPLSSIAISSTVSFLGGILIPKTYLHARRRSIEVIGGLKERSFKYRYPDKRRELSKRFPAFRSAIYKKKRRKTPKVCAVNKVFDNCFVGSKDCLKEESFTSLGVTHLLYLSEKMIPDVPEGIEVLDLGKESEGFFRLLKTTSFSNYDNKKMETWFQKAFRFLDQGSLNGKICICCSLGKIRSATIVIAYLMNRFCVDFETAQQFVESKREIGLGVFEKKHLKAYKTFCTQNLKNETFTTLPEAYFPA